MVAAVLFFNTLIALTNQFALLGFFFFLFSFLLFCLATVTPEAHNTKITNFYKNVSLVSYGVMIGVYLLLVTKCMVFTLNPTTDSLPAYALSVTPFNFQKLFSIVLVYLCYVVGLVSTTTLGERGWARVPMAPAGMLYFPVVVSLLGNASSLLEVFMYYELILLPSVCLVHKTAYSLRSNQSVFFFFVWTQGGSLLVLLPVAYLYFTYTNVMFYNIKAIVLSNSETYWLYLLFFFGFGVKVPVWPLHYWLIKVHVEAPSGFSIFLSGFLVKTGIFCFFVSTSILSIKDYYVIPLFFCVLGIVDSSLKLWAQEDIKKLIAYCTVQEMNLIYLFFNVGSSDLQLAGCFFVVAHSLLSSLMFFLVDCVYRRAGSRSISKTAALSTRFPLLTVSIWFMLISFLGFPGTAKFFAEIHLFMFALEFDVFAGVFLLFVILVIGSVGFAKSWFSLLYGHPQCTSSQTSALLSQPSESTYTGALDLTKVEVSVVVLLTFLSVVVNFSFFFLAKLCI